nr:rhodanese-like domain-containing protein [Selenomonas sp. mPRGC5]
MGNKKYVNQSQTTYRQISSEEAQKEMESSSGYIILDVRTQHEYEEGHIPMAICIPNETIDREPPMLLPNKEQTIYVYCRSGRRSKEAAQKLYNMGYKNIVEFGGINDWHGKVSKD